MRPEPEKLRPEDKIVWDFGDRSLIDPQTLRFYNLDDGFNLRKAKSQVQFENSFVAKWEAAIKAIEISLSAASSISLKKYYEDRLDTVRGYQQPHIDKMAEWAAYIERLEVS